jgi:HSP20 family molecular chaperone IbpA
MRTSREQGTKIPVRPIHCDIKEYEDRYELALELPGFHKEDIKISMKDGYMNIQAEHPETENDNGKLLRCERYAGPYGRTFYVGNDVDETVSTASYKDGILQISLHKVKEEPKNTTIEIQ